MTSHTPLRTRGALALLVIMATFAVSAATASAATVEAGTRVTVNGGDEVNRLDIEGVLNGTCGPNTGTVTCSQTVTITDEGGTALTLGSIGPTADCVVQDARTVSCTTKDLAQFGAIVVKAGGGDDVVGMSVERATEWPCEFDGGTSGPPVVFDDSIKWPPESGEPQYGLGQVTGGPGNDILSATEGCDLIRGGDGADTIEGGGGDDILEGGNGDDSIRGGTGADALSGDAGIDTVRYDERSSGQNVTVTIDLSRNDGTPELDARGPSTDVIIGEPPPENHAAADFVLPSVEGIVGGAGNDVLSGATMLEGGGGVDLLTGTDRNDSLSGGAGRDTLSGLGASDVLEGGDGVDDLSGGSGADTVSYKSRSASQPVVATLDGIANDGTAGLDGQTPRDNVRADVESLTGGAGADRLTGNASANTLSGGAGADTLTAAAGTDVLNGGDGADKLFGRRGADSLNGGTGADDLSGGPGIDRVTYSERTATEGVKVTLDGVANDGRAGLDGTAASDNARTDIEDVVGGAGGDTLTGDSGANGLIGGAGNDMLSGLGGNDVLQGGTGADVMSGGAGTDTVTYAERGATEPVRVTLDGNADDGTPALDAAGDNARADIENIVGGAGDDTFAAGAGQNTILGGAGNDTIVTRDQSADTVDCQEGAADVALVDARDITTSCESVEVQ